MQEIEVPAYFGTSFYLLLVKLFTKCQPKTRHYLATTLGLENANPSIVAIGVSRLVFWCVDKPGEAFRLADYIPRYGTVYAEDFGRKLGWYQPGETAVLVQQLGCTDWACKFIGELSHKNATSVKTVTRSEFIQIVSSAEKEAIRTDSF